MSDESVTLSNGHDKSEDLVLSDSIEAAHSVLLLRSQITELQINASRQSERATIEALALDAVRRLADAYKANDWQRAAEITREICRLEAYLIRRGLV
jgi:hypothetical protein